MLVAKSEVKTLLEAVQNQQQQFSELPEQMQLDPAVPITFTKVSHYILSSRPIDSATNSHLF